MPITSLPSPYGVGTMGEAAREFVRFLHKAGQSYWQILPLGPTGYGDSPYQSFSTFAGNPYYIDLEALIEEGYLTKADCDQYDFGDNEEYVDYEKIYLSRFKVLKTAYHNSQIEKNPDLKTTKKDTKNHGYGVKSCRYIIEKYNGMEKFENSNDEFKVSIMLDII